MSHVPTPIADDLVELAKLASHHGFTGLKLGQSQLEVMAGRLSGLADRVAKLERFHAAVVADSMEEELLLTPPQPPVGIDLWIANFRRNWGLPSC